MAIKAGLQLTARPELKTYLGIRFSNLLEMSEKDLSQLIAVLEKDPLFRKLFQTQNPEWKVFQRQRFPDAQLSSSFYEFEENALPQRQPDSDVESLLAGHKKLVGEIKKIGKENYESYFLYEDGGKNSSEISSELGIPLQTVQEIKELTDQVLIHSDFFQGTLSTQPSGLPAPLGLRNTKVANYRINSAGECELDFFSPNMARGLYKINYDRLHKLKQAGALNGEEKKMVQELIRWLELVNSRKNLIFKILKLLPDLQKDFFFKGDWDLLVPATQRMAAKQLNVTPAAICRAIQSRSVVLPHEEEVSLIDLFPSRKDILKKKIVPLLADYPKYSDREIRLLVQEQLGVSLSRRSINVYRKEIFTPRRQTKT